MSYLDTLLAAGLSMEEAVMVLAIRKGQWRPGAETEPGNVSRLALAQAALSKAHSKTGVAPVQAVGENLEKGDGDPEALERFYQTKGGSKKTWPREEIQGRWVEADESQDPEDYP